MSPRGSLVKDHPSFKTTLNLQVVLRDGFHCLGTFAILYSRLQTVNTLSHPSSPPWSHHIQTVNPLSHPSSPPWSHHIQTVNALSRPSSPPWSHHIQTVNALSNPSSPPWSNQHPDCGLSAIKRVKRAASPSLYLSVMNSDLKHNTRVPISEENTHLQHHTCWLTDWEVNAAYITSYMT